MQNEIVALTEELRRFASERDWNQFHSPKNLATALSVEAAELLEHFQWMSEDDSRRIDHDKRDAVALEVADVLLYLLRLADTLNIDVISAANQKIAINRSKYPVELAKGSSKKYTELK